MPRTIKEPSYTYAIQTKTTHRSCWLCKSNLGVYPHHIDPEHRETTKTVMLCEKCHNEVEDNPELLTPQARLVKELQSTKNNDDGEHFLCREGGMFWMGTKLNGVMYPQNRFLTWEEYERLFPQGWIIP